MTARRLPVALLATVVVSLAMPARADDDKLAQERFAEGRSAFEAGNFAEAARDFEQAYAASRRPALLWNVAQAYRRRYDVEHDVASLRRARFVYANFAELAATRQERTDALGELARVDALLAAEQAKAGARDETAPPAPSAVRPAPSATTPAPSATTPAPTTPAPSVIAAPAAPAPTRRVWPWVALAGAAVVVAGVAVGVGVAASSAGPPSTMAGNYMPCFGCP